MLVSVSNVLSQPLPLFRRGRIRFETDAGYLVFLAVLGLTLVPSFGFGLFGVVSVLIVAFTAGHSSVLYFSSRYHGVNPRCVRLSILEPSPDKPDRFPNPQALFQTALAGLAFVAAATVTSWGGLTVLTRSLSDEPRVNALATVVWVQLGLLVLNMLPALPLSAGRMIHALRWHQTGSTAQASLTVARIAFMAFGALAFAALITGFFRPTIALIFISASLIPLVSGIATASQALVDVRLQTIRVDEIMHPYPPVVGDRITLYDLWQKTEKSARYLAFPVKRWEGRPIGYIIPAQLLSYSEPERSWHVAGEVMTSAERVSRAWSGESVSTLVERQPITAQQIFVVHDERTMAEIGTLSGAQIRTLLHPPPPWTALDLDAALPRTNRR